MSEANNQEGIRLRRIAYWVIILSGILAFLIYFQKLLKPFFLALVFWYFIREIRNLLGRIRFKGKNMPRWIRGTLALIIVLALIGSIGDLLASNIEQIINQIPRYSKIEDNFINELGQKIGMEDLASGLEKRLEDINLTRFLSNILNSLSSTIGNMVMIIIYVVFLLIEEIIFAGKIKIISETNRQYNSIHGLLDQINHSINRYILMKTLVSISTGAMSYLVLLILGVDYPILWAFIIFLFNYIPYVGSLVATLLPAVFAIFQFNNGLYFVYVFLAVEAIQILNGNYIEPRIMGKSLNLSPLVVVLSLTIWGAIWGVLGMILSVPIMSVLTIVMAQFPNTKKIAILLSETGNIESMLVKNTKNDSIKIK
jgi:AI-2 transport protein TqsA